MYKHILNLKGVHVEHLKECQKFKRSGLIFGF